jgi:hypothetical protein
MGIYFDLEKAFDSVDHHILLKKLFHYGIRGLMYQWFVSYLEDRLQYTIVNGNMSSVRSVSHGVPQGSVLGPLLFLIYVNDLPNVVQNNKLDMFADDTNLFVFAKSLRLVEQEANSCVNAMEYWFRCNKLSVNIGKTCFTVFNHKSAVANDQLHVMLYGSEIVQVKDCKYLGITIDDCLKWNVHIDALYKNLIKYTSIFYKLRSVLPANILKNLYYALVHSRIVLGIEIYGSADLNSLDKLIKLNNKILRVLQNKRIDCPLFDLYESYNTLPIPALFQFNILIFMFKYTHNCALLPAAFRNYLTMNKDVHHHNTRHRHHFQLSQVSTSLGSKSLAFCGANLWNKIPESLKQVTSLTVFKRKIKLHLRNLYFERV